MTNKYHKVVIEDVVSSGVSADEQENLLDLFEHAMKAIAATLAREARFDTSDFATAKQRGASGFQLVVIRETVADRRIWRGQFTRDGQRLDVLGSFEIVGD